MNTFFAVATMFCSNVGHFSDFALQCAPIQKYSKHLDVKLVKEYEQFDYHPCKLELANTFKSCKKRLSEGCQITLTDGTVYYSELSCDSELR
jgi:hypothetical protein